MYIYTYINVFVQSLLGMDKSRYWPSLSIHRVNPWPAFCRGRLLGRRSCRLATTFSRIGGGENEPGWVMGLYHPMGLIIFNLELPWNCNSCSSFWWIDGEVSFRTRGFNLPHSHLANRKCCEIMRNLHVYKFCFPWPTFGSWGKFHGLSHENW